MRGEEDFSLFIQDSFCSDTFGQNSTFFVFSGSVCASASGSITESSPAANQTSTLIMSVLPLLSWTVLLLVQTCSSSSDPPSKLQPLSLTVHPHHQLLPDAASGSHCPSCALARMRRNEGVADDMAGHDQEGEAAQQDVVEAVKRHKPRRAGSRGQRSQTEIHVLQRAQASCCQQGGPAFITHGAVVGQVQHPQRGQTSTPAHSSCTGQRWRTDQ